MISESAGYLYVYASNESQEDVYFDNLVITLGSGPVLEETHYCPFGLRMEGISARAIGKLENKYLYNGIEKVRDFGLEDYDAKFRELDPQIGRWWEVDPKTESMEMWSSYASMYNNPISFSDILGDSPGGPGDEIARVGLASGRIYTLTKPIDDGWVYALGELCLWNCSGRPK